MPQDSVLGPLIFLVYINDISVGVQPKIGLFGDYCVLNWYVEDARQIQSGLILIEK